MTNAANPDHGAIDVARRDWPAGVSILLVTASASILLLPALFNRFPLIFPDTPAYLGVGYGHYWTLDRSGFYGLALKPILTTMEPVAALWLAVATQAVIVACVLILTIRRLAPGLSPAKTLLLIASLALSTSLSWHAGQLMPDAATGIVVLMVWLAASRNLRDPGTALLWLGAGLLALVHYTHLGLLVTAAAATLSVLALSGLGLRETVRRAAAAMLVGATVAAAHVAVNGAYFGRWTISPMGSLFLFSRLNEDGLVPRWFDRHCGDDAPDELCALRDRLPADSQVMLWGGQSSPFTRRIHTRLGQSDSWRWVDMLDTAAKGSIRDEPLAFIGSSLSGGARQLVHWQALDDECPDVCRDAMKFMVGFRPGLARPLYQSRQLRGEIDRRWIRALTSTVALCGQLLLVPMVLAAIRRRDRSALSLLAAIVVALLANALMAGALSDVHDRYQSRLVWLAPLAVCLLAVRWWTLVPARHVSFRGSSVASPGSDPA